MKLQRRAIWCQAALCVAVAWLTACANPGQRAASLAAAAGFQALTLQGREYGHVAFYRASPAHGRLWVFLDGDGLPWVHGGTEVARDPTPRHPLGLELAVRTPGFVLYLGRPCYFAAPSTRACDSALWTGARYGEAVVASLVAAVEAFAAGQDVHQIVLVGYSGGGTLAALMAPRLAPGVALVTVAGNLDVDAWTTLHGYVPLAQSLNPAAAPPLPRGMAQIHLVGARDVNVPPRVAARYLARVPPEDVWSETDFDHVCCWMRAWPTIVTQLQARLPPATDRPRPGLP